MFRAELDWWKSIVIYLRVVSSVYISSFWFQKITYRKSTIVGTVRFPTGNLINLLFKTVIALHSISGGLFWFFIVWGGERFVELVMLLFYMLWKKTFNLPFTLNEDLIHTVSKLRMTCKAWWLHQFIVEK